MHLITENDTLLAFSERLRQWPAITVDTEFLRDRTFWPKLCLLQFATPEEARAVDPLAAGIDLAPIFEVLRDSRVIKVFHAARQDLEIFYHQMGEVPGPIFDTQLAAMVAGYGDSVGYETLVNRIAKAQIDKASQYTDWARRPLKERQLSYALADVTHLRTVYDSLSRQLESSGRSGWLDEEMAILTDPGTYQMDVDEAWRRLKIRHRAPRYLAVLKAVAAWREERAQTRDVPRNRILRDEVVQQLASEQPTSLQALGEIRGLPKELKRGAVAEALLKTIEEALAMPEGALPTLAPANRLPRDIGPVVDLLKVLLKAVSEKHGVAQKLIATVADLERIAADDAADVAALKGWRRKIFGDEALALKHGRLALTVSGRRLATVTLADSD
jgi:ribonuclease D